MNNTYLFDGTFYGNINPGLLAYEYTTYALSNAQWTWDFNTYYYTNQDQYLFTLTTLDHPAGGGKLNFTNWQAQSKFDLHSTVGAGIPTNIQTLTCFKSDYNDNLWHIVVVNTDVNTTNITLSLSGLGFRNGDAYVLRDAQDYFNPVVTSVYSGALLNLPLTLTNVAPISGTLTHYTNLHTNAKKLGLFNAFVLTRTPLDRFRLRGIRILQ